MNLRDHAMLMARYNHWMNNKLLNAAALLSDEQRKNDLGAFFGSLHGTFNHLLATDRIWMARFTDSDHGVKALDDELYSDFELLRAARKEMDFKIFEWAKALPDPIPELLHYKKMSGMQTQVSLPFETCAIHWFNHQTHHRGQISTLMMQLGLDPGVTDLISMPETHRLLIT
jgi:uncharacterized damage-inducible protein DinB